jgi:hypothetical protein
MTELYCCRAMDFEFSRDCNAHPDPFECADRVINKSEAGNFGLIIHDGGRGMYWIDYCPWCGTRLVPQTEPVIDGTASNTDAAQGKLP